MLAICSTEITTKLTNMAKNQPTTRRTMDRRWSSEYHFLSKLYNKLLHRPTNDVVNFRGLGAWSVLVLGGSGRGNEFPLSVAYSSVSNLSKNLHEIRGKLNLVSFAKWRHIVQF